MKYFSNLTLKRKIAMFFCVLFACLAFIAGIVLPNVNTARAEEINPPVAEETVNRAAPRRNYSKITVVKNGEPYIFSGSTTGSGVKSNITVTGLYYDANSQSNMTVMLYPTEYDIIIDGVVYGNGDVITFDDPIPTSAAVTVDCGTAIPMTVTFDVAATIPQYESIRAAAKTSDPLENDHTAETLKNEINVYGIVGGKETLITNNELFEITINTDDGVIGQRQNVNITVKYLVAKEDGTYPQCNLTLDTSKTATLQSVSVAVAGDYVLTDGYYKDADGNAVFLAGMARQDVSEKLVVTVFYPNSYYVLERRNYENGKWSTATGETYRITPDGVTFGEGNNNVQVTVEGRAGTTLTAGMNINFEVQKVDRLEATFTPNPSLPLYAYTSTDFLRQPAYGLTVRAKYNTGGYADNYRNYQINGTLTPNAEDYNKDTYNKTLTIQDTSTEDSKVKTEVIITGIQNDKVVSVSGISNNKATQIIYSPYNIADMTFNMTFESGEEVTGVRLDEADAFFEIHYYKDGVDTGKKYITSDTNSVIITLTYPGASRAISKTMPVSEPNFATLNDPISATDITYTNGLTIPIDMSAFDKINTDCALNANYDDIVDITIDPSSAAKATYADGEIVVTSGGRLTVKATIKDTVNWRLEGDTLEKTYSFEIIKGEFDVRVELNSSEVEYGSALDGKIIGRQGNATFVFNGGALGSGEEASDVPAHYLYFGWNGFGYDNPSPTMPKNVGTYYVIAATEETPAYAPSKAISGNAVKFTIVPKKINLSGLANPVYLEKESGAAKEHDVTEFINTSEFKLEDANTAYTISDTTTKYSHVSKDGYTVTLTMTPNSDGNYNYLWEGKDGGDATSVIDFEFNLTPRNYSFWGVTINKTSWEYGDKTITNPTPNYNSTHWYATIEDVEYYKDGATFDSTTGLLISGTRETRAFDEWDAGTYYIYYHTSYTDAAESFDYNLPAYHTAVTVNRKQLTKITFTLPTGDTVYSGSDYVIELNDWLATYNTDGILDITVEGVRFDETHTQIAQSSITIDYTNSRILLTEAGTYTVTISFTTDGKVNYEWVKAPGATEADQSDIELDAPFEIARQTVEHVTEDTPNNPDYDGGDKTYSVGNLPADTTVLDYTITGHRHDGTTNINAGIGGNISGITATEAGVYTLTFFLSDPDNYVWDGSAEDDVFTWTINKKSLTKVTVDNGDYSGSEQTVTFNDWDNVATNVKTLTAKSTDGTTNITVAKPAEKVGEFKATYAGTYTAVIELTDKFNYEWDDSATGDLTVVYTMARMVIPVDWNEITTSFEFSLDTPQSPVLAVKTGSQAATDGITIGGTIYTNPGCTAKYDDGNGGNIPSDAGTYYIKIDTYGSTAAAPAGKANYVLSTDSNVIIHAFTIGQAPQTAPEYTVNTFVYNGQEQTIVALNNLSGVTGIFVFYVTAPAKANFNFTAGNNAQVTDVATYTVYVYPTDNYDWADSVDTEKQVVDGKERDVLVWTFEITPLEVELTWGEHDYTYTKNNSDGYKPEATVNNIQNTANDGGKVEVTVQTAVRDGAPAANYKATVAGEYSAYAVALTGDRAYNYKLTISGEGQNTKYQEDFIIKKRAVTKPTYSGSWTVTYSDTESERKITFDGGTEADYWTLFDPVIVGKNVWLTPNADVKTAATFDSGVFAWSDAGEYRITFSIKNVDNYFWDGDRKETDFNFNGAYEYTPVNPRATEQDYFTVNRKKLPAPALGAMRAIQKDGTNEDGSEVVPYPTFSSPLKIEGVTIELAYGKYDVEKKAYVKADDGVKTNPDRGEYYVLLKVSSTGFNPLNYEWDINSDDEAAANDPVNGNGKFITSGVLSEIFYAETVKGLDESGAEATLDMGVSIALHYAITQKQLNPEFTFDDYTFGNNGVTPDKADSVLITSFRDIWHYDPTSKDIQDIFDEESKVGDAKAVISVLFYKLASEADTGSGALVTEANIVSGLPWDVGFYRLEVNIKFGVNSDFEDLNIPIANHLEVAAREISIKWNTTDNHGEYNGEAQEMAVATVTNPAKKTADGNADAIELNVVLKDTYALSGEMDGKPVNVKRGANHEVLAYTVKVGNVVDNDNYSVTDETENNEGEYTVTPATLTVKAIAGSLTYGDGFAKDNVTYPATNAYTQNGFEVTNGFVTGDGINNVAITLEGYPYALSKDGTAYAVGAAAGSVGNYQVCFTDVSDSAIKTQNYKFEQVPANDYTTDFKVVKKAINVTVDRVSSFFSDPIKTLNAKDLLKAAEGVLVIGDSIEGLYGDETLVTTAKMETGDYSPAGDYDIGFELNAMEKAVNVDDTKTNYTITITDYLGAYQIETKEIAIEWDTAKTKFEYNATNQINAVVFAYYIDPTRAEGSQKVKLNLEVRDKSGSVVADGFKNYCEDGYVFYVTDDNASAGRYHLPASGTDNYSTRSSDAYSITKVEVTITADSVSNHVYGETVPNLGWTVTSPKGFVGSEATAALGYITVHVYEKTADTDLTSKSVVDTGYRVVPVKNTGTQAVAFFNNYDLEIVNGTFDIVKRQITVEVFESVATSTYGAPIVDINDKAENAYNLTCVNVVGGTALANSEDAIDIFTLNHDATNTSVVGTYEISIEPVATLGGNYQVTFMGGNVYNYAITNATLVANYTLFAGGEYDAQDHAIFATQNVTTVLNKQAVTWWYASVGQNTEWSDSATYNWVEYTNQTVKDVDTYYYFIKATADYHDELIFKTKSSIKITQAILEVSVNFTLYYGDDSPVEYKSGNDTVVYHKAMDWLRNNNKDIYTVTGFKGSDENIFFGVEGEGEAVHSMPFLGLVNPANNAFTYTTDYVKGDKAGNYPVTFVPNGLNSQNYKFEGKAGNIEVKKIVGEVAIKDASSIYNVVIPDFDITSDNVCTYSQIIVNDRTYNKNTDGTFNPYTINISDEFYQNQLVNKQIFKLESRARTSNGSGNSNNVGTYAIYPVAGEKYADGYEITFTGSWTGDRHSDSIANSGAGTYTITNTSLNVSNDIRGYRAGNDSQGSTDIAGIPYDERLHYGLQKGVGLAHENTAGAYGWFATTQDNTAITVKFYWHTERQDNIDWDNLTSHYSVNEIPRFIDAGTYFVYYRIEAANHTPVYGNERYGRVEIAQANNTFDGGHFSFANKTDKEWIVFGDGPVTLENFKNISEDAWTYGLYDENDNAGGYNVNGRQKATMPKSKFSRVPKENQTTANSDNKVQISLYYYPTTYDEAGNPISVGNAHNVFETETDDINKLLQAWFTNAYGYGTAERPDYPNAGYYRLHFNVPTNSNYIGVTDDHVFRIGKADLTVKAVNKTAVYGSDAPAFTFETKGLVNNGAGVESASTALGGKDPVMTSDYVKGRLTGYVGNYDINIGFADGCISNNYNVKFEKGTLSITKLRVDITIVDKENRFDLQGGTEDGKELEMTFANNTKFYDDDDVISLATIALTKGGNSDRTQDAGKYVIYAKFNNYTLNGADKSYGDNYEIHFANCSYDGKEYKDNLGDYSDAIVRAGEKSAGTFKITPANLTMSITGPYYEQDGTKVLYPNDGNALVYDGLAKHYIASAAENSNYTFTPEYYPVLSMEGTTVVKGDKLDYVPKDAGNYAVTFISDNPNYTAGSVQQTYTITRKNLSVVPTVVGGGEYQNNNTAIDGVHYYNGKPFEVEYAFTGVIDGEEILFNTVYAGKDGTVFPKKGETLPTFAGTYNVTLTLKDATAAGNNYKKSNYTLIDANGAPVDERMREFTISRALVTIPNPVELTKTFNGENQEFTVNGYNNFVDYQNSKVLRTVVTPEEIVQNNGGTARLTHNEAFSEVYSKYMDTTAWTLTARHAGKYTVKFYLVDTDNYVVSASGSGERDEEGLVAAYDFRINRSNLTVTPDNDATIEYGTPITSDFKADADNRFSGFSVTIGGTNRSVDGLFTADYNSSDFGANFITSGLKYTTVKLDGGVEQAGVAYDTKAAAGTKYHYYASGIIAYNYIIDYQPQELEVVKRNIDLTIYGIEQGNENAKHVYTGLNQQENLNKLLGDNLADFIKLQRGQTQIAASVIYGQSGDRLADLGVILEIGLKNAGGAVNVGKYHLNAKTEEGGNYAITYYCIHGDKYMENVDEDEHSPLFEVTPKDLLVKTGLYDVSANFNTLDQTFDVIYGDTASGAENADTRFTVRYDGWVNGEGNDKGYTGEQTRDGLTLVTGEVTYTAKRGDVNYAQYASHAGEVYTVQAVGVEFANYNILHVSGSTSLDGTMTVVSRKVTVSTEDQVYEEEKDENGKIVNFNDGKWGKSHEAVMTFTNAPQKGDEFEEYAPKFKKLRYDTSASEGQERYEAPTKVGGYIVTITLEQNALNAYDYKFDDGQDGVVTGNVEAKLAFNVLIQNIDDLVWRSAGLSYNEDSTDVEVNTVAYFKDAIMDVYTFQRTQSGMAPEDISRGTTAEARKYWISDGGIGLNVQAYGRGEFRVTIILKDDAKTNYQLVSGSGDDITVESSITLIFNVTASSAKLSVTITGWVYNSYVEATNSPTAEINIEGAMDYITFSYATVGKTLPNGITSPGEIKSGDLTLLGLNNASSFKDILPVNAGYYVVRAHYQGNTEYAAAYAYYLFEITKAEIALPELNVTGGDVYTGSLLSATFMKDGTSTFNATLMGIAYGGNMNVSGNNITLYATDANIDGYPVTVSLLDPDNYMWTGSASSDDVIIKWVVASATNNAIENFVSGNFTFTDNAVAVNANATYGGNVVYSYIIKGSETTPPATGWTAGLPSNVNTYWIKAVNTAPVNANGCKNYNDAELPVAITVDKAELTVRANGGSMVYGDTFDEANGFGWSIVGGLVGNDTRGEIIADGDLKYILNDGAAITAVGGYDVKLDVLNGEVKGLSAANYKIVLDGTYNQVTVTPKTIRVRIGSDNTSVYDPTTTGYDLSGITAELLAGSTLAAADGTVTDLKAHLGITLIISGKEQTDILSAGSYIIHADDYTNKNYNVTFYDGVWTVNRKSLTVSEIIVSDDLAFRNVTPATFKLDGIDGVFGNNSLIDGEHGTRFAVDYVGRTNAGATYPAVNILPKEAGNYTVTVSVKSDNYVLEGTLSAPFVVAKATIDGSLITAPSQKFDGNVKIPAIDVSGLGDFKVYDADGNVVTNWFTPSYANDIVRAGTYPVTLTLDSDVYHNYKWLSVEIQSRSIDFVVTKNTETGANTVTITSANGWTFDATSHANEFTATATFGANTVVWQFKLATDSVWSNVEPINAGNYEVKAIVPATDDYIGAEATSTFTIAQRRVHLTLNLPSVTNVYGNNIYPVTATVTDAETGLRAVDLSSAVVTIFYEGTPNDGVAYAKTTAVPTKAGTYDVSAELAANGNFVLDGAAPTAEFLIEKATVYGADILLSAEYNGKDRVIGNIVKEAEGYKLGIFDIDDTARTDDYIGNYTQYYFSTDTVRTVGEYRVRLKLNDYNNYQWAASLSHDEYRRISVNITIAKLGSVTRKLELADGFTSWSWTFGDDATTDRYKIVATIDGYELPAQDLVSRIEFARVLEGGNAGVWTTAVPVDAGDYYVRALVDGNNIQSGYTGATEHRFSISKLQLKVTVTAYDGVYGENPREATYTATKDGAAYTLPNGAVEIMYMGVSNDGTFNRPSSGVAVMPVVAGTYTAYAATSGTWSNNIEFTSDSNTLANSVAFEIERKALSLSGVKTQESAVYYDGVTHNANADYILSQKILGDRTVSDFATVKTNNGGVNAGSYPVVITFRTDNHADANYRWIVPDTNPADRTLNFVISVGNITLGVPSIASWVYGNNPSSPSYGSAAYSSGVNVARSLITFEYRELSTDPTDPAIPESAEWTTTVPTDAGIYEIRMAVYGTANYPTAYSNARRFTISRAKVAVPTFHGGTDKLESTYNATEQSAVIDNYNENVMRFTVTLTRRVDNVNRTLTVYATNRGDYEITFALRNTRNYEWDTATVKDQDNRVLTWNLLASGENVITIENTTWTYGQTAALQAIPKFGGNVTLYYLVGGNYVEGLPENAGTYTVKATVDADALGNYLASENTATVRILKAQLTATANDGEKTYGYSFDKTNGFGYTLTGFVAGDTESVVTKGTVVYKFVNGVPQKLTVASYAITLNTKTENVDGTARAVVDGLSADNYYIVAAEGTLSVNPKEITVKLGNVEINYSSAIDLSAAMPSNESFEHLLVNNDNRDSLNIQLYTDALSTSNAGSYPINATYNNGNYLITFESGVLTIKATEIRVILNDVTSVYGGTINEPTYKQIRNNAGEDITDQVKDLLTLEYVYTGHSNRQGEGEWAFDNSNPSATKPTLAGNYIVTALNSTNGNFILIGSPTAQFIIEKQEIDANNITVEKHAYTGEELTAVITDNVYNVGENEVYRVLTEGKGTDVGFYTVVLQLTDFDNTKWKAVDIAERELTFEIVQAENRIIDTINLPQWTFGSFDSETNKPFADLLFNETDNYFFQFATSKDSEDWVIVNDILLQGLQAGKYYIRIKVAGTKNYKDFVSEPFEFVVARIKLAKPTEDTSKFVAKGGVLEYKPVGFDETLMNIENNFATRGGDLPKVIVTLKDTRNYMWEDETDGEVTFDWIVVDSNLAFIVTCSSLSGLCLFAIIAVAVLAVKKKNLAKELADGGTDTTPDGTNPDGENTDGANADTNNTEQNAKPEEGSNEPSDGEKPEEGGENSEENKPEENAENTEENKPEENTENSEVNKPEGSAENTEGGNE